jgi:hypothetical protein
MIAIAIYRNPLFKDSLPYVHNIFTSHSLANGAGGWNEKAPDLYSGHALFEPDFYVCDEVCRHISWVQIISGDTYWFQ